jgi:hypothetical protein
MTLLRTAMLAAVVLWFAASLLNRKWGALLGLLMCASLGVWGWLVMRSGQQVMVLGLRRPLAPESFYTVVSLLAFINAALLAQVVRTKRAQARAAPEEPPTGKSTP